MLPSAQCKRGRLVFSMCHGGFGVWAADKGRKRDLAGTLQKKTVVLIQATIKIGKKVKDHIISII